MKSLDSIAHAPSFTCRIFTYGVFLFVELGKSMETIIRAYMFIDYLQTIQLHDL